MEINQGHPSDRSEGSEIVEDADDVVEKEQAKAESDAGMKERDLVPLYSEPQLLSTVSFTSLHHIVHLYRTVHGYILYSRS